MPLTTAIQEEASDEVTCTVFPGSVPTQSAAPELQDIESEVPTDAPLESIGTGEGVCVIKCLC